MNVRSKAGFTLVEMSFVLVIIGLVIVIVFPALKAVRQSTQNQTTQSNLDALMRANAAYVQAHGCLPCPTPPSARGNEIGFVRGDENNIACGTCGTSEGVVPFISLGLPMHMAKDGWGHWITMSVDTALTINFGSSPPSSLCLSSDPAPCVRGESRKGLCQENLPSTNRLIVRQETNGDAEAALLLLSHGENGFGAYRTSLPYYNGFTRSATSPSPYEQENTDGDLNYRVARFSTDPLRSFDDHLRFIGRDALVTYLGNPACQTEW